MSSAATRSTQAPLGPQSGGAGPTSEDRYLNRRAESYWLLRELLERGKLAIPNDPKLPEVLAAIRYGVTSSGKLKIEPKDDLRARLGRSPDGADALTMCCEKLIARGGVPDLHFSHW